MNRDDAAVPGDRLLYLDCFSGLAGDMILAALIDVGVPLDTVREAVTRLPLDGYGLRLERERRQSIDAARFFVDVDEAQQPHRHYTEIREMIGAAGLAQGVTRIAQEIFAVLARAEARAHGATVEDVHFHEVGAVDSIVDIVAACAAMELLDIDRVLCSAIPVGSGTVRCEHGLMPVPAPATARLLVGAAIREAPIVGEATTPTAAAVLTTLAESFGPA
ncbi:MAG TPA: LarC family nickel insertion protein, partial [Polyangia bacterium]|nr:LarC family nickel insertion protein [Polyangia bacterium]